MANSYQSISSGLAELKNFYQGPIQDQLNEDCEIWRGSEKGKYPWSGYQVIRPLKVRRNQGVGATSDGGALPAIGVQTTVQAIIPAAFNYLRFGVTGPMIAASQNDKGSFVRAAAYELEEGYNDLRSDVNRQLSWDGTGYLATVNTAAVASTSLVIAGRESTEAALKFIDVGIVVDIYTTAGVVKASGVTVNAITSGGPSSSTATLTLSAAVTCAANDVLVRANSWNQEMDGLLTALDGGTSSIYGVDRSTYLSFQGNEIDLSGAVNTQLQLDIIQRAEDEAERRGGRSLSAIYSDHASRRYYIKLLQADKRFPSTIKGDGGFADQNKYYLEYNGKPWIADKDCPTRVFFLPEKQIEKYVLKEMEFADETGTMYIAVPEADELEVRLRLFANLFNSKPAASAVIVNYTSP